MASQRLKFNIASCYDGLPAEIFKAEGDELVRYMHHLLCNIKSLETMQRDWSLSLLCSILKKGDTTICSIYRGISLHTIPYRILPRILCERLKPFVNKLISSYQCGFKPGKSTVDETFTLHQILEKTREKIRFFDAKWGFRQGDSLSCDFFNIRLKAHWVWRMLMILTSLEEVTVTVNESKIKYLLSTAKDTSIGYLLRYMATTLTL